MTTASERAEANPDAEGLRWSDEDLLQALNCVRRDEQGDWQPTVPNDPAQAYRAAPAPEAR